jgi:selenocysteine-specific elongation factor
MSPVSSGLLFVLRRMVCQDQEGVAVFVLGTAGHIDHGKSALVQALTGMDPDRLHEEKERGMTIDLGFAWLTLPGGQEVGIVDVPGHERFVTNMLAGVGSIDLALLIIAANEGVMPQTREHLAILDLLGIDRGIVVVTKKDLVDQEWLELVRMDIEELLKSTTLARAPVVAVSAITRDGLDELVATIDRLLPVSSSRKDSGRPRLPIDRVFTIPGSGTIVTGTLIDGSLSVGQEVEIVPPGLTTRLRGLQTHKTKLTSVTPGSRVAANVVGIATTDIKRGDVLTKRGWLLPTSLLSVEVRLLPYMRRPLRHNVVVSFHTGAAESMAKIRLLDKDRLEPGGSAWAQVQLETPLALVKGDRFIIRSPMETLGGGTVVESHAKRLRRFKDAVIEGLKTRERGTIEDSILGLLETRQPLELKGAVAGSELPAEEVGPALETLVKEARAVSVGQGDGRLFYTASGWEKLVQQAAAVLQDHHKRFPARMGIPKVELASRLKLGKQSPAILSLMVNQGAVADDGLTARLPTHEVRLTPTQEAAVSAFLRGLVENPYSPPSDRIPEPDLLNLLIERRQVVKTGEGVVFGIKGFDEMVGGVVDYIRTHEKVTLAEARDLFKTSRRYVQSLLEYMDDKKITRRVGDDRVLY